MFGVTKETFENMLEILESANKEMQKQGGRPSRLSILDKLVVMLGDITTTETQIQRPKRVQNCGTQERKSNTQ